MSLQLCGFREYMDLPLGFPHASGCLYQSTLANYFTSCVGFSSAIFHSPFVFSFHRFPPRFLPKAFVVMLLYVDVFIIPSLSSSCCLFSSSLVSTIPLHCSESPISAAAPRILRVLIILEHASHLRKHAAINRPFLRFHLTHQSYPNVFPQISRHPKVNTISVSSVPPHLIRLVL